MPKSKVRKPRKNTKPSIKKASKKLAPTGPSKLTIGGEEYKWTSPKFWALINIQREIQRDNPTDAQSYALFDYSMNYVRMGLGKKGWARLEARLNDPASKVDYGDLMQAVVDSFGIGADLPSS